jgi:hypothetical protein
MSKFFKISIAIFASMVVMLSMASAQQYGNPYGNDSNSNKVYAPNGEFRGNLNDNRYDPNSVSNPYGTYGSKYSSKSLNNPYATTPSATTPRANTPRTTRRSRTYPR